MSQTTSQGEQLSPKVLAQHLRQPTGETGKQIGLEMNKSNRHICLNTYQVLAPAKDDHILEIGMGNGFFIKDLLAMADGLMYTGVDFSDTMIKEATDINKTLIDAGKVQFEAASIEKLPFADNTFNSISTTNTLYFWPGPQDNILELLRVLKPGGKLLIAYRDKSLMQQLEATNYGFTKYDPHEVESLLASAGFKNITTQKIPEPAFEFNGHVFKPEGVFTEGFK